MGHNRHKVVRSRYHARAELWAAMHMPQDWYGDSHGAGESPRCCAVVDSLEKQFEEVHKGILDEMKSRIDRLAVSKAD